MGKGNEVDSIDLVNKALRYKEYFKDNGGITLSGGEPLLQVEFSKDVFKKAKEVNINTCLDTSGSILNDDIKDLLKYVDRVLLDIKYTNNNDYLKYVGCNLDKVLDFLEFLNDQNISTTIRQVIIPTLNDDTENINKLNAIIKKYRCIDKVELLPFKKICKSKYDSLNMKFSFESIDETSKETIEKLEQLISISND
jgi:pyruvate formate lyase activating enzyme